MKTYITGLVAAVMALTVFASAGFATSIPYSSADVASQLVASGLTTYSTESILMKGTNLVGYTGETWGNIGTISSLQSVSASGGKILFFTMPTKMQVSEITQTTGLSSVDQFTGWNSADANIYNVVIVTPVLTHAERVDNLGTGTYGYSADTVGATYFNSAIGINAPTNCMPATITIPVMPNCAGTSCPHVN